MGYDLNGEILDFKEMEKEKEDMDVYNETTFSETPPAAITSPIKNEPEKASDRSNLFLLVTKSLKKC